MTNKEKKDLIQSRIDSGDVRSYNELVADLELQIWTMKMKDITEDQWELLKLRTKI